MRGVKIHGAEDTPSLKVDEDITLKCRRCMLLELRLID